MATPSYRERMKAARAADIAQRKAQKASRQRQIELVIEVKRLAKEAVIYSIRAAGLSRGVQYILATKILVFGKRS